ncbi:hypothetical protein GF351_03820 [Candidatus Woesearchaeota archaeon]|nr:hypothetical protein [Candidatus Woesearchaeota archaeon]
MNEKLGHYSFLVGIALAIIFALVPTEEAAEGWFVLALVILGLIVGFLNIKAKEVTPFLISAIALMVIGTANISLIPAVGPYLQEVLLTIVVFVAPAALVVSIKSIMALAEG